MSKRQYWRETVTLDGGMSPDDLFDRPGALADLLPEGSRHRAESAMWVHSVEFGHETITLVLEAPEEETRAALGAAGIDYEEVRDEGQG